MGIVVIPAPSGGATPKVAEFTSTGTFTVPSNCSMVDVLLVGGGGGGGFAQNGGVKGASGGGGGAVIKRTFAVTPGASYTITVGAGGAGATGAAPGSDGGDTSFGSLAIAYGGGGGASIDTSSTLYSPRMRGTLGGVAQNSASAPGGAGASENQYPNTNTTPFSISQLTYTSINGVRQGGWGWSGNNNVPIPGKGIDGFGGGGGGGFANSSTLFNSYPTVDGGGRGRNAQLEGSGSGFSGTANTGGGGGGGASNADSVAGNGGNGGSGFVRITYWS